LILPDWLITTPQKAPQQGWGVRVVDDRIGDVASHADLRHRYPDDERWDAPGTVLAPGFVNAHMHLYGVLAHGIPLERAPSGFWPFLEEFWWPLVEDALDHEMIRAATDLQCARMLLSGVTSFYDCLEAPFALPGCLDAEAEVVARRGMRAILSFEATERVSAENGQLGLQENAAFIDACNKTVEGYELKVESSDPSTRNSQPPTRNLISGAMCIHTTFTCSEPFIRQAHAMARERDVFLHAHVSEGTYEPHYNLEQHDVRTLHVYDRLGVAGPDFLASQCVQIDQSEIDLMAERGVRMAHMPLSNCEVGGGIAPLPELVGAGVTAGLGTDGYIDDFFEVMRGAFLIHKASHLNPQVLPAHQVWYLATEGGARALGLEKVGRLEPGWQADLQLIAADLPTPLAAHNLYDQLLLYRGAADVRATMVAGQVRVREGALVDGDCDALRAGAHEAAERLWAQARKERP
jgi:cytosine/adenosine deaminase-related metal-dependent hydrolase